MSLATKVLKTASDIVGGLHLCKDILVASPTEHILRGFLLERTAYKDRYYLWAVIAPLYRPMRDVILNYSSRIANGEPIYIRSAEIAGAAEAISGFIVGETLERVKSIDRPIDFLHHISWMVDNTVQVVRFDFALTYYMVGDIDKCLQIMDELVREMPPDKHRSDLYSIAKTIIDSLSTNPVVVKQLVERIETINIKKFLLSPTMITSFR